MKKSHFSGTQITGALTDPQGGLLLLITALQKCALRLLRELDVHLHAG